MSGVTFEGVTKRFGDVTAVDNLSLDIADREFMVLLGPSGCGKTTALRMIAGLDSITEGTVSIGDSVVNDVSPSDRDIAMVFQSYALYPHMTVRKNIESPLRARRSQRLAGGELDARVNESAQMLGLNDYLDRKPGELSGGQRQRVALARAIVRRPRAFLMDEPLSNLDAKLRTQTRLDLVELWRTLETTFVYVTHDQVEAMTMASRVAVIADGRLQQVGVPQDVYDRPENEFVASFIGNPPMNLVSGTMASPNSVTTEAGNMGTEGTVTTGTLIRAGIRPEHLIVLDANTAAGMGEVAGGISAEVLNIELLGHERHLICRVGGSNWVVREHGQSAGARVGDNIELAVEPRNVHLFGGPDGLRVN